MGRFVQPEAGGDATTQENVWAEMVSRRDPCLQDVGDIVPSFQNDSHTTSWVTDISPIPVTTHFGFSGNRQGYAGYHHGRARQYTIEARDIHNGCEHVLVVLSFDGRRIEYRRCGQIHDPTPNCSRNPSGSNQALSDFERRFSLTSPGRSIRHLSHQDRYSDEQEGQNEETLFHPKAIFFAKIVILLQ